MKIVVTGGAGFIGSHLCKKLLRDNNHVICVDNFLTGSKKNIENLLNNKNFQLIDHDVIKPLGRDIDFDALFHLASPASPNHHSKKSYHNLAMETMLVNTQGTLELLKLCHKKNAKFLFASSSEIYGDPLIHPQKENYNGNVSSTGPRSVYDEAKRFGETLVSFFTRKYNLDARIARIFNTYGPNMSKDDMRMVCIFINQALENKPITIYGDGKQTRSLCFVDDMVEALSRLMFYQRTKGEIINLGNINEYSVFKYAELIKKLTGSKSKIVFSETLPVDDPKKRKPDISKAKKILNWSPKVNLKDGLRRMINYYKENII